MAVLGLVMELCNSKNYSKYIDHLNALKALFYLFQCGLEKFLQLYTDLAIYALNLDKGIWDCAKSFCDEGAIGMSEKAIARTCVQIHNLYQDLNPQVQQRSIITAFALDPSPEHFTQLGKIYEKKIVGMQKLKEEGRPVFSNRVGSDSINVDSLKHALPSCGEQTVAKQLPVEKTDPVASTSSNSQVVITDNTKMQMQVDMGSARILEKGGNTAESINPATLYEMDRLLKLFRPWFFNPLLPWKDLYIVARDYIANDKTLSPEIETQIKRTIERIEDEHDRGCDTVQLEQGNVVSRDQFLAQVLELQKAAFRKRGRGRPPLKKVSAPETDNKEVQKSSNLLEKMYKTVYKCLICSTLHEDVQQLKEHVRSICRPEETDTQKDSEADTAGKQPSSCPLLKCRLCSSVKPTLQEFELHLATNHAAECDGTGGNIKICHLYRCKYCKVFFSRREDLQNHLNVCSVKLQKIANGEIQPKPTGDSPASVVSSCSSNNEDGKMLSQNMGKSDMPISGTETDIVSDGTPVVKKKRGRKKKTDSAIDLNSDSGKKGFHFVSTSDSETKQPKKRGRKRKELVKDDGSHTDTNESQSDRGEGRKVFHRKVKDVAKENSATRELIEKLLKSKNDDSDHCGKGKSKTKHGKLCEICATKFRNSKTLLQHYAMSHIRPYKFFTNKGKNAFMCFYCRKFFVTFLKYVNHIHLHEQRIISAVKTFKTTNPGLTAASGPKSLDDSDSDFSDDTVNLARPAYASTDSSTEVDASESRDSNFGTEESSVESSSLDTQTVISEQVQDNFHFTNKLACASGESLSAEVDLENKVSSHLIPNSQVDSSVKICENADSLYIQEQYIEKVTEESAISSCEKTSSEYEPSTCLSSSEMSTEVESNTEESVHDDVIGIESVDEEFMQFRSAPTILQGQSEGAGAIMLETSISGMEMTPLPSDWNASLHTFVENVSGGQMEKDSDHKESVSRSVTDMTETSAPIVAPLFHSNNSKEQQDSVQCDLVIESSSVEKPQLGEDSMTENSVKQKSFADEFASLISMSKSIESVKVKDKTLSKLKDNDQAIPSPDCGHPANLVLSESDQTCTTLCPNCGQIVPGDPSTFTPDSPPCMTVSPALSPQNLGNPDWRKMLTKQLSVTISAKDRALCSLASKKLTFGVDSKSRKARSISLDCDNKVQSSVQHQRHRRSSANVQGCATKVEGQSQILKSNSDVKIDAAKKVTRRVNRSSSSDPSWTDPFLAKTPKNCVKEKQISLQKTEVIIDTVDISGICALFATCESDPMNSGVANCGKRNSCIEQCAQDNHLFAADHKGVNSREVTGSENISRCEEEGRVGMESKFKTVPKGKVQSGEGEKNHVGAQPLALLNEEAQADTNIQSSDNKNCFSAEDTRKGTSTSDSSSDNSVENSEIITKDVSDKGHAWSLILNIVDSKPEESLSKHNFSVENSPPSTKDGTSVAQLTLNAKEYAAVSLLPCTSKELLSDKEESEKPSEIEEENATQLLSNKEVVATDSCSPDKADFPFVKVDNRDCCDETRDFSKQREVQDEIVHSMPQESTESAPTTHVSFDNTVSLCPKPPDPGNSSRCSSPARESLKQVKDDLKESPVKPLLTELLPSKINEVHNKSRTVEIQSILLSAEVSEASGVQRNSDCSPTWLASLTSSCVNSCIEKEKEGVFISSYMSNVERTVTGPIAETSTGIPSLENNAAEKQGNEFVSQHRCLLKSVSDSLDSAPKSERGTSHLTQLPVKGDQNSLDTQKPETDELDQRLSLDPKTKSQRTIAAYQNVEPGEIIVDKGICNGAFNQVPHENMLVVYQDALVVSSGEIVETRDMNVGVKDEFHACPEELKNQPSTGSDEVLTISLMSGELDELAPNRRDGRVQPGCTELTGILAIPSDQLHNNEDELVNIHQPPVKDILKPDDLGKRDGSENACGLLSVTSNHNEETVDVKEMVTTEVSRGQIHVNNTEFCDNKDAAPVTKRVSLDSCIRENHTAIDNERNMLDVSHPPVGDVKDDAHNSCRNGGNDTQDIANFRDKTKDHPACAYTGEVADVLNGDHVSVALAKDTAQVTKDNGSDGNHTKGAKTKENDNVTCSTEDNSTVVDMADIVCDTRRTESIAAIADVKDAVHGSCMTDDDTPDGEKCELAHARQMSAEQTSVADVKDLSPGSWMSENCTTGTDSVAIAKLCCTTEPTAVAHTNDIVNGRYTCEDHIGGADKEDNTRDINSIENHTRVRGDTKDSCILVNTLSGQNKKTENVFCTTEEKWVSGGSKRVIADASHMTLDRTSHAQDGAPGTTTNSAMSNDQTASAPSRDNAGVPCRTEDVSSVTGSRGSASIGQLSQDVTSVAYTAVVANDFAENVSRITGDVQMPPMVCSEREITSKHCVSYSENIDEKSISSVSEVIHCGSEDRIEDVQNHNSNVNVKREESSEEHSSDHVLPCLSTRSKNKISVVLNSEETDSQTTTNSNLKEEIMSYSPENKEMPCHLSRGQRPSGKEDESHLGSGSPSTESNSLGNLDESHLNKDKPDLKTGGGSETPSKRKPGRPKKETPVTKNERMVTRQTPINLQLPISRPQRKRTRTCLGNDYIYQFPFKQPRNKESSTQIKKETTLKHCDKETKSVNVPLTRLRGSLSRGKDLPVRCGEAGKTDSKKRKMFVHNSRGKNHSIAGNRGRRVGKQIQPSSADQPTKPASKKHKTSVKNSYPQDVPQKILRSGKKTVDYQKTTDTGCSSSLKSVQKMSTTDRVTRSSDVPCVGNKSPGTEELPVSTNLSNKPSQEMSQIHTGKENMIRIEISGLKSDTKEVELTNSDVLPESEDSKGDDVKTSDTGTCLSGSSATPRNGMNNLGGQKCETTESEENAYQVTETPKHVEPDNTQDACVNLVNSENTASGQDYKPEIGSIDQYKDKSECQQEQQDEDQKCCDVEKMQITNPNQAYVKFEESWPERTVGITVGVHAKTTYGTVTEKEEKLGSGNIYRVQRCAGTQTSGGVPKNRLPGGHTYGDKMKVVTRDTSMEIDAERKANFVRMGRTMSLKSRLLPKSSKPFTWDMDDNGDHISSGDSRDSKKQADTQPEEPTLLTLRKSLRSRNFEPIHRDKKFEVIKRGAVHKAARDGHGRVSAPTVTETGSARNIDSTPFEVVNRMATRRAQKSQNESCIKRPTGEAHITAAEFKTQQPGCTEENIISTEIKGVLTRVSKRKVESGTNTDIRITKCAKIDNVVSAAKPLSPKGSLVRNCQWASRRNQRTPSVNSTNIIVTYPGGSNSVITANPNTSKNVINNHIAQQLSGSSLDQVMAASKQQDRSSFDDCANSDSGSSNGDSSASGQKWKMQRKPGKQGFSFSFTKARIH